jgi:hypothetical protein
MPRRKKEPHLFLRKARYDKKGRLTHRPTWIIKDGDRQTPTGCGRDASEAAELRLHEYNVEKHAAILLRDGQPASKVVIGDLIALYLRKKATDIKEMRPGRRRERLNQLGRLNEFWGSRYVSDINEETSKEYQKERTASTVRNELTILRAVVNLGELKGKLNKGVVGSIMPFPESQRLGSRSSLEMRSPDLCGRRTGRELASRITRRQFTLRGSL